LRTDELALDYIDRAELTLDEARGAFEKEVYSLTIRRRPGNCRTRSQSRFEVSGD
jgi:hypothetical protein